jgi:hypothetical protein
MSISAPVTEFIVNQVAVLAQFTVAFTLDLVFS